MAFYSLLHTGRSFFQTYLKKKSKTKAKQICLLRLSWFITQFVGRLSQGLPVTLLEINTLTHVIYSFFIDSVWWNKSFGISEPTVIKFSDRLMTTLYTAIIMRSEVGYLKVCRSKDARRILEVGIHGGPRAGGTELTEAGPSSTSSHGTVERSGISPASEPVGETVL
ncbi:hypothetical protein F4677DRAFT_383711 [Hypoxylon crocopeplum]|nr:hypothetical protein F4677DRAFT_383711 [Hypoxylon crocopeplum]